MIACLRVVLAILSVTVFVAYYKAQYSFQEFCTNAAREQPVLEPARDSDSYCVTTSKSSGLLRTHNELCYSPAKSQVNVLNVQPFKGEHAGQSAVLLCTGPTLNEYVHEEVDEHNRRVITVGLNGAIFTKVAKTYGLDYVFVQDAERGSQVKTAFYKRVDEFTSFKPRRRTFYGLFRTNHIGPTDEETAAAGATRYESEYPACADLVPLVADVGRYTFGGSCSVAMSALQFLLYTGVSYIKLVGCDITKGAYAWEKEQQAPQNTELLRMWELVPDFLARHYPNVVVEVIRPVGLKGIQFNRSTTHRCI